MTDRNSEYREFPRLLVRREARARSARSGLLRWLRALLSAIYLADLEAPAAGAVAVAELTA